MNHQKTILLHKNQLNILSTPQKESQRQANDSKIAPQKIHVTPQNISTINEHVTPQNQILEFTLGDEGSAS